MFQAIGWRNWKFFRKCWTCTRWREGSRWFERGMKLSSSNHSLWSSAKGLARKYFMQQFLRTFVIMSTRLKKTKLTIINHNGLTLDKGTDGKHLDDYLPPYTHKWFKKSSVYFDPAKLDNMLWGLVTIQSNLSLRVLTSMIEKWRRNSRAIIRQNVWKSSRMSLRIPILSSCSF